MPSTFETITQGIYKRLSQMTKTLRNEPLPQEIPSSGLLVLFDGEGEKEGTLGGFKRCYYRHTLELDVYVQEKDAAKRDQLFDDLLMNIEKVLDDVAVLNQAILSLVTQRPKTDVEHQEGAASLKTTTLLIVIEYEAPSALG